MDCTTCAGRTRAAPTLALLNVLLLTHDEAPDRVFWPNPERKSSRKATGETATQRQSRPQGSHPWGWWLRGWRPKMVGVATTTIAAGVTAVVVAGGAHWMLVFLRAPPRGKHYSQHSGQLLQLWRRQRRVEGGQWKTFSVRWLVNFLPLVFGLKHGPRRADRGSRKQLSRAMAGGAYGPKAFTLLLRVLMTHFDRVDTGEGCTRLHIFRMCNGTPFSDLCQEFRVLVSTATGSERVLFSGTNVVLGVVRMAVNEQRRALMPAVYPGSQETDRRPYASLVAILRAFCD